MRYFIFLIFAVLITGCVESTQYPEERFDSVPPSRLYGFTKRSDAHLIILRDRANDSGCTLHVSIDGRPAAEFESREKAHFGLTMGTHKLSSLPDQDCLYSSPQSLEIAVKIGDALVLRIADAGIHVTAI